MASFLESAEKSFLASKSSIIYDCYWWNSNITDRNQFDKITPFVYSFIDNEDTDIDHVILLLLFAAMEGEI